MFHSTNTLYIVLNAISVFKMSPERTALPVSYYVDQLVHHFSTEIQSCSLQYLAGLFSEQMHSYKWAMPLKDGCAFIYFWNLQVVGMASCCKMLVKMLVLWVSFLFYAL